MKPVYKYLILFVVGLVTGLLLKNCGEEKEIKKPITVTVTVPEVKDSFEERDTTDIKPVKKSEESQSKNTEKENKLLEQYKKANDSLKQELLKKLVSTNDYEEEFTDSVQSIKVKANVTGSLNTLSLDYTIFERKIKYDTIVSFKVPENKINISGYIEGGIDLNPILSQEIKSRLILKAGLDVKNKKNWIYGASYDTRNTFWLKLGKGFDF